MRRDERTKQLFLKKDRTLDEDFDLDERLESLPAEKFFALRDCDGGLMRLDANTFAMFDRHHRQRGAGGIIP